MDTHNVRNATGIIMDEKRTPVQATTALAGSASAQASATDEQVKTLRQQFIEAGTVLTVSGKATGTWLSRSVELFQSAEQSVVRKALAARKRERGEKSTTTDVYLSETRKVMEAFFTFPAETFAALVHPTVEDEAGKHPVAEEWLPRPVALGNIRAALDEQRDIDRINKQRETLAKAAEQMGFRGDEVTAKIDEAVARKQAEREAQEAESETPEGKVRLMAKRIINMAKLDGEGRDGMHDWTIVANLCGTLMQYINERAAEAHERNELTDTEAEAFGLTIPEARTAAKDAGRKAA